MATTQPTVRSRFPRTAMLLFGLTIGLFGIILSATPYGRNLEHTLGLKLLFKMRGPIASPDGVVVVGIDTQISELSEQENNQERGRRLLAELIDVLVKLDVSVIAIDLILSEHREDAEDFRLQKAIEQADRVILYQEIMKNGKNQDFAVEPLKRFEDQAEAIGSLVVPMIPARADYFWPFFPILTNPVGEDDTSASNDLTFSALESPSLPLAALHLQVQRAIAPGIWNSLLKSGSMSENEEIKQSDRFLSIVRELRVMIQEHEALQSYLLSASPDSDNLINNALYGLITTYAWPGIQYINFYGPATTIPTVSSADLMKAAKSGSLEGYEALKDKVVFIGYVPTSTDKQIGRYLTTFVDHDGLDLSAVEIAATAYLNLRYREWLKPVVPLYRTILIFLVGFCMGFLSLCFRPTIAIATVFALSIAVLGVILWQFRVNYIWLPTIIPFARQLPSAILVGLLWRYLRARKQRSLYRRGLRLYVPKQAVEQMEANGDLLLESELTYCTCLFADIAEFTPLSEKMSPVELAQFSNNYFSPLCHCVQENNGDVLSTVGDEILAVWSADKANKELHMLACNTALQMISSIAQFNKAHSQYSIFTRFGIHSGWVALGNIGDGEHLSYNITGDTVNSAKRIEDLNKILGTQTLVTGDVVEGLDEFLLRPVGSFVVKGKAQSLEVYELCGIKEDSSKVLLQMHTDFAIALGHFKSADYETAYQFFVLCRNKFSDDGPTTYYLDLLDKPQKLKDIIGVSGQIHLKRK